MGDYRMGRCVEACLLTHYTFAQPSMESLLTAEQTETLAARGIDGPSALRLALWDVVNETHGGFASPGLRDDVLGELGEEYGLPCDVGLVDALLSLDSDASATLIRMGEQPKPSEIAAQYNRGAVKTLLAHSTRVTFSLTSVPGAVLKRTYFVAKRRGVLVDVDREGAGYALTLYGPEQASGGANYGLRLADVSLRLLRSLLLEVGSESVVSVTAYLVMHDREYRFHITPEILARLDYVDGSQAADRVAERGVAYSVGGVVEAHDSASEEPSFDSMVEAKLYREFKSLERQGYTHGWRLLREPDPLLAPGVVMIPDFAFSRGEVRVFMEIAGFWSPTYREKKLAKLRALAGGGDDTALILAVPQESAGTYSGLPYPVAPYKTGVRATDLLTLLNARYGERERREDAAQAQLEGLREAAQQRGYVPEQEVASALQAYSRTELLSGARLIDDETVVYVPGVGLLSREALGRVEGRVREALEAAGGKLPLDEAARFIEESISVGDIDVESLVAVLVGVGVERPSLFEAYLVGV